MINSAEEFVCLRTSTVQQEYSRASNEDAPLEVWIRLVADFPEMRVWVAHNKTVPISILEQLARDPDVDVRWKVATKRKLTLALQWLLARDVDEYVRERVAWNAKVDRSVLEYLAQGADEAARTAAKKLGKVGEE